jgi:RNA polymerase sigma factor (sigma-70 family)
MNRRIAEPPGIATIFDKKGCDWTIQERLIVKEWLFQIDQLRDIWLTARYHLGDRTLAEDAKDAWSAFYVNHLDQVINSYCPSTDATHNSSTEPDGPSQEQHSDILIDPGDAPKKIRFGNYLKLCFKRFCHDEGERIRKRRGVPLEQREARGEISEIELVDKCENPEEAAMRKERASALLKCMSQLQPDHRIAISMHHLEGMPVREIAMALGVSEAAIKVRLHRGRQQLKKLFEKETDYYEQAND